MDGAIHVPQGFAMSTLREYLVQKRSALLRRRAAAEGRPSGPRTLEAQVSGEGRSGVRRIRIRAFQVISDSTDDFARWGLGPSSPELQLGVLGSCLTHVFLIQAANLEVSLDALRVTVQVELTAVAEGIRRRHEEVEAACPILNLLVEPQTIQGTVHLDGTVTSRLALGAWRCGGPCEGSMSLASRRSVAPGVP